MTPEPKEPEAPAGPDAVLRALADPHRRQILRLVQHAELPAGQIAANFEDREVLAERREGTRRLYSLRSESLEPVRSLLDEFWPDALARLKQSVEQAHSPTERRRPT
jgi:DNA-binding transcriptional ArsR family regulator